MKKVLYYASWLLILPILILTVVLLDQKELIEMSTQVYFALIIAACAVIGNLATTDKKFDYIMTGIIPFLLLSIMFIVGFLDKDDMGYRFHIYRAFNVAFQPLGLQLYFLSAFATFVSSFKPLRIIRIVGSRKARCLKREKI